MQRFRAEHGRRAVKRTDNTPFSTVTLCTSAGLWLVFFFWESDEITASFSIRTSRIYYVEQFSEIKTSWKREKKTLVKTYGLFSERKKINVTYNLWEIFKYE